MRYALVVAGVCACQSTPASNAPPPQRDDGAATALPIPAPAFEGPAPADAIVDLTQSVHEVCATRRSGHVDCWRDGAAIERLSDIADATKVRFDVSHRCVLRAREITCFRPDDADSPPAVHVPIAGALDAAIGNPSCALLPDHRVQCFGEDDGKLVDWRSPSDVVSLAASAYTTCAVQADGKVSCFDDGTWQPIKLEHVAQLVFGEGAAAESDYYNRGCARLEGGSVRCIEIHGSTLRHRFDLAPIGELATGSLAGVTALAMQGSTLTAVAGGKVVAVTESEPPRTVPKLADAVTVTPSCARRAQGSVVCWGNTMLGQPYREKLDKPTTVLGVAGAVSIATHERESWAVTRDGRVFHWGGDEVGWAVPIAEAHDTAAVALVQTSIGSPCFLRRDHGVTCLGYRTRAPVDLKLANVVELVAGNSDYTARLADGSMRSWGDVRIGAQDFRLDAIPRFPDAEQVVGERQQLCARDRAGAVWCAAGGAPTKMAIPPAKSLAFAADAVCALLETGDVSCWGGNQLGELGRGSASEGTSAPAVVPGIDHVIAIGAHPEGFCAERADGSLTCWGARVYASKPKQVLPPGSLEGPFSGGVNGCTIRKNGLVACWGDNHHGRVGDGSVIKLDVPAAVPGLR